MSTTWKTLDIDRLNDELFGRSPQAILRWAVDTFAPSICLQTSLQRRSSALFHMLHAEDLSDRVKAYFVDTGYHFEQTLEAGEELARRYQIEVVTIRPEESVEAQRARFGRELWRDPQGYELCCELRKVRPWLLTARNFDAVLGGLVGNEGGRRQGLQVIQEDPRINAYMVYPFASWSLDDLDRYNTENDVYLHPLHHQSYPSIGCATCTTPVRPGESYRAGRWRHIREAVPVDDPEDPVETDDGDDEALYCNINWIDRTRRPTPTGTQ